MKHKKFFGVVLACILLLSAVAAGINRHVISYSDNYIPGAYTDTNFDAILVLGCGVRADGTPSRLLADRIRKSTELYKLGVSGKIIMSGDHGRADYDEVNTMKNEAISAGIPSEDVFMDHAGFSTYDSMYRAKNIFKAKKLLIVTQKYHLSRAVYIARHLGLDAYGSSADYYTYRGQYMRDAREAVARIKDFFSCIIKPPPKYLGESIPVSGNGNITNDK